MANTPYILTIELYGTNQHKIGFHSLYRLNNFLKTIHCKDVKNLVIEKQVTTYKTVATKFKDKCESYSLSRVRNHFYFDPNN